MGGKAGERCVDADFNRVGQSRAGHQAKAQRQAGECDLHSHRALRCDRAWTGSEPGQAFLAFDTLNLADFRVKILYVRTYLSNGFRDRRWKKTMATLLVATVGLTLPSPRF